MKQPNPQQALRADVLLLGVAFLWGIAFAFQRQGAEHLQPLSFNAARYLLATACLGLVLLSTIGGKALLRFDGHIGAGALLGVVLFMGTTLQQAGLAHTTAGKAGFITGLYVVLVPLIGLVFGQRPGWLTGVGAAIAVAGLFLLSVKRDFTMGYGDVLVLIGAFCWAAHVLLTGHFAQQLQPLKLAFWQFAITGALSGVGMLAFEAPAIGLFMAASVALLYTGLVATAIAFTLQITAQKHSPPSHAALIMSLETVFAALGGWLLLSETLTLRDGLGAALMLAGILLSQVELFRPTNTAKSSG